MRKTTLENDNNSAKKELTENLDNSLVCELLSATMGCSHRLLL